MENDPLEILIMPHEVVEWHKRQKLLTQKFFPQIAQTEREKGKFAIFHDKLRLGRLFESQGEAEAHIEEIVGNKRRCIENKRVFSVKQL